MGGSATDASSNRSMNFDQIIDLTSCVGNVQEMFVVSLPMSDIERIGEICRYTNDNLKPYADTTKSMANHAIMPLCSHTQIWSDSELSSDPSKILPP